MSNEAKSFSVGVLAAAVALALVISAIAWPVSWYQFNMNKTAMENGYEKGTIPGSSGTHWIKKAKD